MTRPPGSLAARWRRWRCAGAIALMTLAAGGCHGPKIPAGNLKELKEKKRELKEAQRKAEEEAPAPEPTATPPADESGAPPPAVVSAPSATGTATAPLVAGSARVTLRTADGNTRQLVLRQPLVGRWERTFLSSGGVRDKDRLASSFEFRDGLGRTVIKMKKVARVEWAADAGTRTGVRLRFQFQRADRAPEEFAAEDLLGADHPMAPFLLGIDPRGVEVRLPLYPPLDTAGYEPIVELEFGGPG